MTELEEKQADCPYCHSDGRKYLINVDKFTVDEIGVDHVGED